MVLTLFSINNRVATHLHAITQKWFREFKGLGTTVGHTTVVTIYAAVTVKAVVMVAESVIRITVDEGLGVVLPVCTSDEISIGDIEPAKKLRLHKCPRHLQSNWPTSTVGSMSLGSMHVSLKSHVVRVDEGLM